MKNVKLIHYCWTCKKEHDLSDQSATEYGIKCNSCDGFVVTPSGKVQMQMIPTVKTFLFDDGERHWIAANTQGEAEQWYKAEYIEDDEMGYKVSELTLDEINVANVFNYDRQEGEPSHYSLFDLIKAEDNFPCCLATTVI